MQQPSPQTDPVRPIDPTKPPSQLPTGAPAVVEKTSIPELGIAGGKTQNQASSGTPSERSTQFVPVEGGAETTSAEALLVAAYIVMWALLLGFVFRSWKRQQSIEVRVDELERALRPKQ